MSEDRLSSSSIPADGNMCLSREESSSHGELDDALSTTSDSSVSHRLNDVGDVQHIAKLQEESLKESPIVQSQQQSYIRSATISPSSEHSPLTEEGNPVYDPSEDGSLVNDNYSSQDSLPDSPYSSQSLDSQPASGQDRLRRSMPNLNKIRHK
ncbi:SLAIN1_2 [Lepeophtheirus salmonis]|uniref:SLAIN1_2 n=1 Tax=Lepeophtheirus salmonis TaxID=72036 RepID=A0A7R8CVX6_LEPSM|nr:SLAIN1_2 [Lepeophtheirus salmonis]CAF2948423.1 SLAIN1_2 [Lepeophtheirus salmonis]